LHAFAIYIYMYIHIYIHIKSYLEYNFWQNWTTNDEASQKMIRDDEQQHSLVRPQTICLVNMFRIYICIDIHKDATDDKDDEP
jgi:hypothetical protein